jgi:anthranilate synthase component II
LKAALIDFRDSFTYNIAHYLEGEGVDVTIYDHLDLDVDSLKDMDLIVLSPGPGLPQEKPTLKLILQEYFLSKPILGICLGMQGVVNYFGGQIYNQKTVKHGVQSAMKIAEQDLIFKDVPLKSQVGLYHSWACCLNEGSELIPLAYSEDGVLMAVRHRSLPIYGLQFHPESILTEFGRKIIQNFIEII